VTATPMRMAGFLALGAVCALLHAWPLGGANAFAPVVANALILAAALEIFLVQLPRRMHLANQILLAMLSGVTLGYACRVTGQAAFVNDWLMLAGTAFVLLLKFVALPIVFFSILNAVSGFGNARQLGKTGALAAALFAGTSVVAVTIGLVVGTLAFSGGEPAAIAAPEDAAESGAATLGARLQEEVLPRIVHMPVFGDADPLALIFTAIFLGAALSAVGEAARSVRTACQGVESALIVAIHAVLRLAPLGVLALMARAVTNAGAQVVGDLAWYTLAVVFALLVHVAALVTIVALLTRTLTPPRFLRGIFPAVELAFSTSSSMATLPVTLDCVIDRLRVRARTARLVLPLGATTNMDGSAAYVSITALFLAAYHGIALDASLYGTLVVLCLTLSIGAAGVPGAIFGMMSVVITAIGLPVETIGLVAGVERILDMSRTAVNITGDSAVAALVDRLAGDADTPDPG